MTPNTPPQGRDRGCALVITTSPMPTIPARDDPAPAQVAALLRAVLVLVESGEVEAHGGRPVRAGPVIPAGRRTLRGQL